MVIKAGTEEMKNFINRICQLKLEMNGIETEFRDTGIPLGKDFNELSGLIREILQELESLGAFFPRCAGFINDAVFQYNDAENKIASFAAHPSDRSPVPARSKYARGKPGAGYKTVKTSVRQFSELTNISEPCRLPKCEALSKYSVKPGKIEDGKNIPIRTWI